MNDLEKVKFYKKIATNYQLCSVRPELLSDTWGHSLQQKGGTFPLETLDRMLELGNPVNSWIDDFNYVIDSTILDIESLVIQKLLAIGEPNYGNPRKDCRVGEIFYSSNFVHQVLYAAKIIEAANAAGISNPRILEIGGGLGGIAYLLKSYYGSSCTYYVVDLPEGLFIQEWYLKNVIPQVESANKLTANTCNFIEFGFNYINGYVLDSQKINFDIAINIDSMQEMNAKAVGSYIKYIESNIAKNGIFYFQNHYGHSPESVSEPSEYPFDEYWEVSAIEAAPQIECCCSSEQLRLILQRRSHPNNSQMRTAKLRKVWGSFMQIGNANVSDEIVLENYGVNFNEDLKHGPLGNLKKLKKAKHFGSDEYNPPIILWKAHKQFIEAMEHSRDEVNFYKNTEQILQTLKLLKGVEKSPFYSAQFSLIAFFSGFKDEGERYILSCCDLNPSPVWLVRLGTILIEFDCHQSAKRIFEKAKNSTNIDWFSRLKMAELVNDNRLLIKLANEGLLNKGQFLSLMRTAIELEAAGELGRLIEMSNSFEISSKDILSVIPKELGSVNPLIKRPLELFLEDKIKKNLDKDEVFLEVLNLRKGQNANLLRLNKFIDIYWDSYPRLAWLGKTFLELESVDNAIKCFDRSIELRPGAFLHHEYIGNAYLHTGMYDLAQRQFRQALDIKPYLRHIQAKNIYCNASDKIKNIIGGALNLDKIFQRGQDFYHHLGPPAK